MIDPFFPRMSYHLHAAETVGEALSRIALEQIDEARAAVAVPTRSERAPHEVRKRCKKLRGLLRLVRGSFPDSGEQTALRDAARSLASARAADAHLEAIERLRDRNSLSFVGRDFEHASRWLTDERARERRASAYDAALLHIDETLEALGTRVSGWRLDRSGFDAIVKGLVSTYRKARAALGAARRTTDAEHLHRLRKHIKYHRYHLDLLHRMWPGPLAAIVDEAEHLGELLGQHHDLDELLTALEQLPEDAVTSGVPKRMRKAIATESARLESEAFPLAARLLADKPDCFRARMATYWNAWHEPD